MDGSTGRSGLPAGPTHRGRVVAMVLAGVALVAVVVGRPVVSAVLGGGGDSYAFIRVDANGDPVTWDRCTAIRYQVNPEGAPENWRELVDAAFDDVAEHSGFVFKYVGETRNRVPSYAYTPGSTRGEPVLVMWSSQGRMHSLQGDTVGLGGGASVQVNGRLRLVTGLIALDKEGHSRTYDPLSDLDQRLILEHEIGHVLGLDHVADGRQLMAASYTGQKGLGEGDVNGLRALHAVPCG